jgi:DNA (cytosine-5)-methyltransferase 1
VIALDICCCAGGASDGIRRAGFDVQGCDLEDQPEYPHPFTRANLLDLAPFALARFDFIWASPPRQKFTAYKRRPGHVAEAPNLIPQVRELLKASGVPYVIENVPGAPLENPITLCGSMFGLDVRRHRIFECSFPVTAPPCNHAYWRREGAPRYPGATNRAKNSRLTIELGVWRIPVETQRRGAGIDRPISLEKLSQVVPPAYAEWLGLQARAHILTRRRAA